MRLARPAATPPARIPRRRSALRRGAACILLASAVSALSAQRAVEPQLLPESLDARLRAIYQAEEFAAQSIGPTAWLDGGTRYTSVTRGEARDLVAHDTATGTAEVLVPSTSLVPPGGKTPLVISNYAWSADKSKLLIFTNTRKVWRQNTRGDYWVLSMAGLKNGQAAAALKKVGGDAPEASLMFAKFSPDGSRVAYVRAQNVYVEDLASGRTLQLTADGGGDIINGTSDWVNEEEFSIRDAFRWSPDGRSIAYWQFDTTGVERFTLVNNTAALYPQVQQFPYPKPGTRNSAVRVGVVPAAGGATTWVKTAEPLRDFYIPRMDWADAGTIVLQQMNRLQNRNDVLLADARTGTIRQLLRDESRAWVEDMDEVTWLDGGREFVWVSEKDGWRHAYAVARDGGKERLLTRFEGDLASIASVDAAGRRLYFIASPQNATQRYLYVARLDGDGAIQRVTPADQSGTHSYNISPDGKWAMHTWSRFDSPPKSEIVSLPDHKVVRSLVDNAALVAKVAPVTNTPVEFLTVTVDGGFTLDGYLLKPKGFDPSRKYPVIVHVYGEPAGTTVNDSWGGTTMLFHRALADEGYVIVSFDNRGTPALKGAAWRKIVYGTVGELSAKEQAAAIRALTAQRSVPRCHPDCDLGLERRWLEHLERDVPLPRRLPGRRLGRARPGPAPLRHHLPGTLHGLAGRESERVSRRFADSFRRGVARPFADRARQRRRQRSLSGHRAADQPAGGTGQAVRHDGLSESLAQHLGGSGHVAPHLPAGRALPAGAPARS